MLDTLTKFTDVKDVNVSKDERWASMIFGAIFLLYAMIRIPLSAVLAAIAAGYLFFRGFRGFCYFYDRLGMNKAVELPLPPLQNNHKRQKVVSSQ